jgi:hypothetical protein|tara:strand:+ start:339 stop:506 length:168 start_codon:yes stop_codon:yes gene_type:complete
MALPKAIANALNKRVYPSTMSHVSVLRCKYDGRIPPEEMAEAQRRDAEDFKKGAQ